MNKTLKRLLTPGAIALSIILPTKQSNAQLPFFTGQSTPTTYAVENRTLVGGEEPKFKDILVGKTFRKEVPIWAYLGNSYNDQDGFGSFFYGVGGILNIGDRFHMLPTAEGSGKEFSGLEFYTTLDLGRGWNIDLISGLNDRLNYTNTSFNVGKTHKGLTFGVSSDYSDGKLRDLRDTDIRVAKIKKGNFFDIGVNFGKKRVRVALQKAF